MGILAALPHPQYKHINLVRIHSKPLDCKIQAGYNSHFYPNNSDFK